MPNRHLGKPLVIVLRIPDRMPLIQKTTRQIISHHQTGYDVSRLIGVAAKITTPCSTVNLQPQRHEKEQSKNKHAPNSGLQETRKC